MPAALKLLAKPEFYYCLSGADSQFLFLIILKTLNARRTREIALCIYLFYLFDKI